MILVFSIMLVTLLGLVAASFVVDMGRRRPRRISHQESIREQKAARKAWLTAEHRIMVGWEQHFALATGTVPRFSADFCQRDPAVCAYGDGAVQQRLAEQRRPPMHHAYPNRRPQRQYDVYYPPSEQEFYAAIHRKHIADYQRWQEEAQMRRQFAGPPPQLRLPTPPKTQQEMAEYWAEYVG